MKVRIFYYYIAHRYRFRLTSFFSCKKNCTSTLLCVTRRPHFAFQRPYALRVSGSISAADQGRSRPFRSLLHRTSPAALPHRVVNFSSQQSAVPRFPLCREKICQLDIVIKVPAFRRTIMTETWHRSCQSPGQQLDALRALQ